MTDGSMPSAETRQRVLGVEHLYLWRAASTGHKSWAEELLTVLAPEKPVKHGDRLPFEQHSALLVPPADRCTNGSASGRSLVPLQGIPARIENQVWKIGVALDRGV